MRRNTAPPDSTCSSGGGAAAHRDSRLQVQVVVSRWDWRWFLLQVVDLHSLLPTVFLEIGGGTCHIISYTTAVSTGLPTNVVVVSQVGVMFGRSDISCGSVITAVNGRETHNIEALIDAVSCIPDGETFTVSKFHIDNQRNRVTVPVTMDRRYVRPQVCVCVCVCVCA